MAKYDDAPIYRTVPPSRHHPGNRYEKIPVDQIGVEDMLGGMVTTRARTQQPPNSGLVVRNARVRDYWLGRRPGTADYITKPDSNPVLKVLTVYLPGNRRFLVRVTDSSMYSAQSIDGWQTLTGSGLTGSARMTHVQFLGYLFLAGAHHRIMKVDLDANTYEEIEGAPRARFITSFADRVVAANILPETTGATKIQWSGNAEPFEWDPLENESAGEENLISSPSDTGDDISGIFALTEQMVILRERSFWIATRQPIAYAPFRFTPLSTNQGCDLPYSACRVENGVIWADYRTKAVWYWVPGGGPQRLSEPIDDVLYEDLANLTWAEGAYDPFNREYHLGLSTSPSSNELTKIWVFNFETASWTYDDSPTVTTIGQVAGLDSVVMIDDLVGTIDAQNPTPDGVIDDWETAGVITTGVLKGTSTGEVLHQSYDYDNDWDDTAFEFEFQSPNVGSSLYRRTIQDLMVTVEAPVSGSATLEESNDETTWKNQKVVTITGSTAQQRIGLPRRQISGNELYWRIKTSAPQIRLRSYWLRVLEKFLQRQS